MSKTYRVGIIGVCHVHVHNVALLFKSHPRVELVAVADTPPRVPELREAPYSRSWNLQYLKDEVGIPASYSDYRELLKKEDLDLVICNSENAQHPDVVAAAAEHGVHVCVEKPMAASLEDARTMVRTAEAAGSRLLIHWGLGFSPVWLKAKSLVEEGLIGRVLQVRMQGGHAGPLEPGVRHPGPDIESVPMTGPEKAATWWYQKEAGGGAMIDFCSYGVLLARWLLGEPPVSVLGMRVNLESPWSDVDDNGAIFADYGSALGVFEGTWTTRDLGKPWGPVLLGSKGTLLVEESETSRVRFRPGGGEEQVFEPDPLPAARTSVAEEFIRHLELGTPLHPTLDMHVNLDVMAVLDAGLRSSESGRRETVEAP